MIACEHTTMYRFSIHFLIFPLMNVFSKSLIIMRNISFTYKIIIFF